MLARFLILCSLIAASTLPTTARAAPALCNETSYVLQAAVAFTQKITRTINGWQTLLPGTCTKPDLTIPPQAQLFVYAHSDNAHLGAGLTFDGQTLFCVHPQADFTFTDTQNCQQADLRKIGFATVQPYKTKGRAPRINFGEKYDFLPKRATTAGIQRLLRDLGYDIGEIDGIGGSRTRDAINAYRLRYKITTRLTGEKLLRQIYTTARREAKKRGLYFCNKTAYPARAAIGQVTRDGFRTQGWFYIAANECTQAINHKLTGRYYFYYAESIRKNDTSRASLAHNFYQAQHWQGKGQGRGQGRGQDRGQGRAQGQAGEQNEPNEPHEQSDMPFCVKPTRFMITTHENCTAHGFDTLYFRRIDIGSNPHWQVDLE